MKLYFSSIIITCWLLLTSWQSCCCQAVTKTSELQIDFSPFHRKIREVLQTQRYNHSLAIQPTSTSLDCVYPKDSIIFTYSTHYTKDLLLLQRQALEIAQLRSCFDRIFISICLDNTCQQYCTSVGITNCVLLDLKELPPSDFNQGEYRFLTYVKQDLFREALHEADSFFFVDVDCLLFKNPFVEIQYGRDRHGNRVIHPQSPFADHLKHQKLDGTVNTGNGQKKHPGMALMTTADLHKKNLRPGHEFAQYNLPEVYGYDIVYQRDRGRTLDCSGSVNTGQVYMKNSTRIWKYFERFAELKPSILNDPHGPPEQDWVANASFIANLRICSLTPHLFTAHCYMVFGNIQYILEGRSPIKDIISYHVACVNGLKMKINKLKTVMEAVRANQSGGLKSFL